MAIGLPEGFELDEPQQNNQPQTNSYGLPEGFELDNSATQPIKQEPQMGRGEAAFITATNPLNFGDEIKAGIAALTAKTFGGAATKDIDIGDLYREARTSERNKLKQAQETYPIQSAAIGFASDIPFEAAVLGKGALKIPGLGINAIPGLNLTGSIPKLAAGGALLGAAGGAGASEKETAGGVVQDALASGAIGAVAAPALASAIPAATNIDSPPSNGTRSVTLSPKPGGSCAKATAVLINPASIDARYLYVDFFIIMIGQAKF